MSIFTASASAFADFKVKFDCYLPGDVITCPELEKSFYGQFGYLTPPATAAETELVIQVRSTPIAAGPLGLGTAYTLHFLGNGELPQFTLLDRVPQQVSDDNRFIRLLANLGKGMAPFLSMSEPAKTLAGETTMVLEDPHHGPAVAGPASNSRLFVAPSLSGNYSKTSIEMVHSNASLEVNWSSDRVRAQGYASASYTKISLDVPGGEPITASVVSAGAQTLISYNLAKHWSVAAIAIVNHKASANQRIDADASLGVEWVMVPFMKTSERNLSIRYAAGPNFQSFVSKNMSGDDRALFIQHVVEFYCFWHFTPFDVSVKAGASTPVAELKYLKTYGNAEVIFRLTKSLTLGMGVSASRQQYKINEPAQQDSSNPVQSFVSGGQYSETEFSTNVSLKYIFGNSALTHQDQRWRNFGNGH